MVHGRCLCGAVSFQVRRLAGPFELCHCTRCRQVSGSAFMAGVGVRTEDFTLLSGADAIAEFALPVRDAPPAYRTFFCKTCGSPVPNPRPQGPWLELPAGLLEGELEIRPDKHIYVEHRPAWGTQLDVLPDFTAEQIRDHRAKQ